MKHWAAAIVKRRASKCGVTSLCECWEEREKNYVVVVRRCISADGEIHCRSILCSVVRERWLAVKYNVESLLRVSPSERRQRADGGGSHGCYREQ